MRAGEKGAFSFSCSKTVVWTKIPKIKGTALLPAVTGLGVAATHHSQRPPFGVPHHPHSGAAPQLRTAGHPRGVRPRLLRGHFGCARKLTVTFLYSLSRRIIMSVIPSNWDAALFEVTISNLFHSIILFSRKKKKRFEDTSYPKASSIWVLQSKQYAFTCGWSRHWSSTL